MNEVFTRPVDCATESVAFACGPERLAGTRLLGGAHGPRILALPGLGKTARRETTHYLLADLASLGLSSMSFDFSGNGDSTGVFEEASLRRRFYESQAAVQQLDPSLPPVLLGTSMGGHLACSIAPSVKPSTLVLFCPAAYPAYALDVPFDGNLARPGRYPASPAFQGIQGFTGDLLVIAATHDQVVPREVPEHYMDSAVHARSRQIVWLDCDHFIHRWLPDQARMRHEIAQRIANVVTATHERGHSS